MGACASAANLATLIEVTLDAHATNLAKFLGVDLPEGRVTPIEGNRTDDILMRRA